MISSPSKLLKQYFGYSTFRDQQEEIIQHVLDKKDTVVLMPTGGGKSICFQIPALIFEGTTLVISPLISLMKDQVEALKRNGIPAEYVNSTLSEDKKNSIREDLINNKLKLIYAAPETLFSKTESWISGFDFSLVAIDEAHCVSMWGHDFRPEYTQIKKYRDTKPETPFIALTATADKLTRLDIQNHTGLKSPRLFLSSFDRPNINLRVQGNLPKKKKVTEIVDFIESHPKESGIIYCLSRKETESMKADLMAQGIKTGCYHAGLSAEVRFNTQDDFLSDRIQVVCATVAFGMGIDKSDVRWVIHNNLPKNVEGYYQEIGRAGRDGLPAQALLYYNYRDVKLLVDFAKDSTQSEVLIEKVNRMVQYAEATSCRRKILLSYFSQNLKNDCGNCDVCAKPPKKFEGTILCQMALSGVTRADESLSTLLLIDLIRGAKTADIFQQELHLLKTYGVGKEHSWKEWSHYITEMKNLGLFEIAYDQGMKLKITPFGNEVLYGKHNIHLSVFEEKIIVKEVKKSERSKPTILAGDEMLFDRLRILRKKMAVAENVPPYIIFSDASLNDMTVKKPTNSKQFLDIHGVGQTKADKYAAEFCQLIVEFSEKITTQKKSNTFESTRILLEEGLMPREIADQRQLSIGTVYAHIMKLYQEGNIVDLTYFISDSELKTVKGFMKDYPESTLKEIFEGLEEKISYDHIKIVKVLMQNEKQLTK
jgi:ATP-dependent DNA helicase RecQ